MPHICRVLKYPLWWALGVAPPCGDVTRHVGDGLIAVVLQWYLSHYSLCDAGRRE
jgi:hypothetical protein